VGGNEIDSKMVIKAKTLYVTDLDGTLLNKKSMVSDTSRELLNKAILRGALFSVATARSPATVSRLMQGVYMKLPAIVLTGAMMWQPDTYIYTDIQYIPEDTMQRLYRVYARYNLPVFIYRTTSGKHIEVSHYGPLWEAEQGFIDLRSGTPYKRFLPATPSLPSSIECRGVMLCYSMQKGDTIERAYEEIRRIPGLYAICYHDLYGPDVAMMEVFAETATKAEAVKRLKQQTGADCVVVFGDNVNDLPMMRVADHAVAVANAVPEVLHAADEIISDNDTDAVAGYISRHL